MVQACDDRQVKSLLLRSYLMFLLVDKKTVKEENEQLVHCMFLLNIPSHLDFDILHGV